jgi:beta-xylosidase
MRRTYTNPVHPGSFPDPFVLAVDGVWYAYATDAVPTPDRAIPAMRSADLVA